MKPTEPEKNNTNTSPVEPAPVDKPAPAPEASKPTSEPASAPETTATTDAAATPEPATTAEPATTVEPASAVKPAAATAPSVATPEVEASDSATSESSNKTGLFIGLGVGLVAVIGIIAAVFLIPQMLSPNYSAMFESSDVLRDKLTDYFYDSACHDVGYYVDDYYVGAEEYNAHIADCRKDAEEVYAAVSKFESESGVSRDSEINDLYLKFKKVFDMKAPAKERLEETLKVYDAVHSFIVEVNKIEGSPESAPTPEEFKKITNPLTSLNDAALKEFGEGLNRRYTTFYEAMKTFSRLNYRDANYRSAYEAYEDASDELSDYLEEQMDNLGQLNYPLADTSTYVDDDNQEYGAGIDPVDAFDEMQDKIIEKAY